MTKVSDERLAEMPADLKDFAGSMPGNWPEVLESRASAAYLDDTKGTRDLLRATAVYIRQSLRSQPEPAGARVKGLEWVGEEGLPGRDISAEPTPEIRYTVRHLDMDTFDVILNTDLGSKWFRNDGEIHASYAQAKAAAQADYERRILSALTEQQGEAVGLFRKTDGAWKQVPDEWADHPNVQPLYASPSIQEPVAVTNEMVERAARAIASTAYDGVYFTTRSREQYIDAEWRNHETDARTALTASLSQTQGE